MREREYHFTILRDYLSIFPQLVSNAVSNDDNMGFKLQISLLCNYQIINKRGFTNRNPNIYKDWICMKLQQLLYMINFTIFEVSYYY